MHYKIYVHYGLIQNYEYSYFIDTDIVSNYKLL